MITQYIPDLIGEVVGKVDQVLFNKMGFHVHYDWGHDLEVIKNLSKKDKDLTKPKKYPLVWFVMNFRESMGNLGVYTKLTGIQMYIMMNTQINYSMKDRRDNVFLPVLYPVYAELLKQFALSKSFVTGPEQGIPHTKIDMPYWSKNNSDANFYNDFIDAIQIADLKFDVKNKIC